MRYYLDFEKPVADLENKIEELKNIANGRDMNITSEIKKLEKKAQNLRADIFSKLTPWQKTLIARHSERPHTSDYINFIMDDFIELHGDRKFADDKAVIAGFAKFMDRPVAIIGHQKGKSTKERIERNFGQAHPEGYRKALRIMKLAERYQKPVITFIDTPGAYPGIGAEERGQAEAISRNLLEMFSLKVPLISVVIGEGGSGGALALSIGDKILMLEHSVYSVISPEGCAAILWKKSSSELNQKDYERSAEALKITAQDLLNLGINDEIINDPPGGAHRDHKETAEAVKKALENSLREITQIPIDSLIEKRYAKFMAIGSLQDMDS